MTKSALITGASSGIGAEFAQQLAARGYDLTLVARREERLEQLAQSLKTMHARTVTVLPVDLSTMQGIDQVNSVIASTTNLELLVNNAGFGLMRSFIKKDAERELALVHVHILAPVMLSRASLPAMVSRNRGGIINVSSMAGIIPIRSVLYGTSKAFLIQFSEALQEEVRNNNIRVQALCPGFVTTEFHDAPEFSRFQKNRIPGFLWLSPERIVADSLKAMERNRVICVPGRIYGIIAALARNGVTSGMIKRAARYIIRKR
jgi:uncharacterized protein